MHAQTYGVRTIDPEIEDWLQLIRAEYLEIPDLRLTKAQVQRLWGLDPVVCETLLTTLVSGGFLRRTRDATYVRLAS